MSFKEWRVECDECEEESVVRADEDVLFCPCCGRRATPTMLEEELDFGDEED
jgi:ribosomal protein L37AE/L43A